MTLLGGHLGSRASALLDSQLSAEETERAWAHVSRCPACADRIERESWLKSRLAGLGHDPGASASAALRDELRCGSALTAGELFPAFDRPRGRRTIALVAFGGGAVGAAIMGVLAFGAGPANAPTSYQQPAVTSVAPNTYAIAIAHIQRQGH